MDTQQILQWLCQETTNINNGTGNSLSKAGSLKEVIYEAIDFIKAQAPAEQASTLDVIRRLLQGEVVPGIVLDTPYQKSLMGVLKSIHEVAPGELASP